MTTTAAVRYLVSDVAESTVFYRDRLGFEVEIDAAPGFASLRSGGLRLMINAVGGPGGASQAMSDGSLPEPGGWNRIQLEVTDLDAEVERLRGEAVSFRNDIVRGRGGAQILVVDPSGNLVELFEPAG